MTYIKLFHGKPRSGKTFINFYLSYLEALKGTVVLRNYLWAPELPNNTEISPYDMVRLLDGGRVPYRRLFSLQEVDKWFNSYRGMSDVSIAEAAVVFQAGKLGINIIGDSQLVGRVDSCLKDNADERWEACPYRLCDREKCLGLSCKNIRFCKFRYYQLDTRFRDKLVRLPKAPKVFPFRLAVKFWDLFDTWTLTKPVGWDSLKVAMERTDSSIMNDRINEQVELLLSEKGCKCWRKTDRVSVKSALLELGESPVFADVVSCRLGLRLLK